MAPQHRDSAYLPHAQDRKDIERHSPSSLWTDSPWPLRFIVKLPTFHMRRTEKERELTNSTRPSELATAIKLPLGAGATLSPFLEASLKAATSRATLSDTAAAAAAARIAAMSASADAQDAAAAASAAAAAAGAPSPPPPTATLLPPVRTALAGTAVAAVTADAALPATPACAPAWLS